MKFFIVRDRFKPISITGSWCALSCKFCNRRYLENMIHVDPSSFPRVIRELYENGVRGVLISGGFREDMTLPIEQYIDELRAVKRELGITVNSHLGLVRDRDLLVELRDIVDVVDYEFTLSKFIVRHIRGLDIDPGQYIKSLELMLSTGIHVVPHVFAWYPGISRSDFTREIETLSNLGISEITLLVYVTSGNIENKVVSEVAKRVVENIEYAKSRFPGDIYLGCMRPGWLKPILDPYVVERELVERMANPYYKALYLADKVELYDSCCSIPRHLLGDFKVEKYMPRLVI